MSSPEQKAKELVDRMEGVLCGSLPMGGGSYLPETKACALICVEEIIENIKGWDFMNDNSEHHFSYWQKVKEEIQKL